MTSRSFRAPGCHPDDLFNGAPAGYSDRIKDLLAVADFTTLLVLVVWCGRHQHSLLHINHGNYTDTCNRRSGKSRLENTLNVTEF